MDDPLLSPERKEFEAWALAQDEWLELAWPMGISWPGEFEFSDLAWQGWQAAKESSAREIETLRAKVKELALQALSDSGQAIEALERERVLIEVLRECDKVLSTIEPESTDEDEGLRKLLRSVERLTLLRHADERDLLSIDAARDADAAIR